VDPSEEEIVAIAKDAIDFVKNRFDIEPKVALLSHSNFGTYEDCSAIKMKNAAAQLRADLPGIEVDGEMHALSALNESLRNTIYGNANLTGRANLLVMPNMDAASIALGLIRSLTNARLVGPFLYGLNKRSYPDSLGIRTRYSQHQRTHGGGCAVPQTEQITVCFEVGRGAANKKGRKDSCLFCGGMQRVVSAFIVAARPCLLQDP